MNYLILLGVLALLVIAGVVLYWTYFAEELIDDLDVNKITQFLDNTRTENRTLSKDQLDKLYARGLVLMRRVPAEDDQDMVHKAMFYRGRGRRGRRGGFRRSRWGRPGRYYRNYYWAHPSYYYDIWNPFYFNYASQSCWVRGYDGYMYALQYVNGRCPLEFIV